MLKKHSVLILLVAALFFNSVPKTFAFVVDQAGGEAILTGPYYDSSQDKYIVDLKDGVVRRVVWKKYSDQSYTTIEEQKTLIATDYGGTYYNSFIFECNRGYEADFYDYAEGHVGKVKFIGSEIQNQSCSGGSTPEPPPDDSNGCIGCDVFNCPGWDQYMGKVNQIINAIPPAPNWNNIAGIMRDTIVPRFISDLGNMLGSAPTAPTTRPQISEPSRPTIPEQPPSIDISTNEPDMQDVPGLKDSGFDKDKIESEAPTIEFREDPTGGFEITDPVNTLPEMPTNDFPVPGQTDAGEWEQNKPPELENPYPYPSGGEEGLPPGPIPPSDSSEAPIPGDDTGSVPMPGGGSDYTPPTPDSGGGWNGTGNYKKHPDDPDGSG